MTINPPPMGTAGRVVAAVGALFWILSMFLTLYSRGSESVTFWQLERYTDVVTIVLAVTTVVIATASLYVAADALLSVIAVIGGYLLALAVTGVTEARDLDVGAGGYVGVLGAVHITAGAVMAIAPRLATSPARVEQDLAFMGTEPVLAASGPRAGWYVDPADSERLRYWQGSAREEHRYEMSR